MSNVQTVLQGSRAPYGFEFTVTSGGADVDLSTVTSVSIETRNDVGIKATWSASIDSQSETHLDGHHTFDADGLETASFGRIAMVLQLSTPDGPYPVGPFYLVVAPW